MNLNVLDAKINQLGNETESRKALDIAIEVANEVIKILQPSMTSLPTGEDVLDEAIPVNQFPNQKVESWFANHPYFTGEKVALRFYTSDLLETKFYWLSDNATKARISAGVMLTPNWEDSELTRNDSYKVGLDFFLSANAKSLLVVISNSGNLRILELNEKLSHTQREIFTKLQGAFALGSRAQIHKSIWDALALNEVNKKFYAGIAEQFNILLNHLIKDGKNKEDAKLFASRLLGRLLFLWFLRKKGIVNEEFNYFALPDADSTNYYNTTLKRLFFETLNTPIYDRDEIKNELQGRLILEDNTQSQSKLFRVDEKTPYLNGGLFEAHDNDWPHQIVNFPTGFFNGLYEHLEKYNFTTDESSPEYEQVAIDPEMLGRVFENLLATQLTETGDQARNAKGAFYTPREIVSYMCKESLRQYLYTRLDNDAWNDGVDKLIDLTDSDWEISHSNSKRNLWGEANRNVVPLQVIGALNELKILDPACGSGAFPMGMLQLILKTYERLDNTYDQYKKKLQIIQENIYGVDIEPMAVEISRLRAWLSLIVDDKNRVDQVDPLPNLDFKFVCANSLIPLEKQTGIFADANLHEKLADVRIKFFNARKPEMKDKWKKEYYKLTGYGQTTFGGNTRDIQLKSFDPFKNAQHAEFFDADYMFGVSEFDLVIGNPPYVQVKKETIPGIYYPYCAGKDKGKQNLYKVFIEHGYNSVKEKGFVCYITQSSLMCDISASGTRDLLLNKASINRIIEFPKVSSDKKSQVFDSVLQGTCIIIFAKAVPGSHHSFLLSSDNNTATIKDLKAATITAEQIKQVYPQQLYIPLVNSDDEMRIFIKTSQHAIKLKALIKESQQGDFNLGNDKNHFGTVETDVLMYRGIGFRKYTPVENVNKEGEREYILDDFKVNRVEQNANNQFLLSHNISGTTDDSRLVFTVSTKNKFLCGDSINKILLSDQTLNETILGLLNSKLMDWLFRKTSTNNHVNSYEIDALPVPEREVLMSDKGNRIAELVRSILIAKAASGKTDTSGAEREIDKLVYALYELAPEEVNIIEGA